MRIVSEDGVCAFTVVAETIAAAAAMTSADLIRWLMGIVLPDGIEGVQSG
jgi:hypothetical protein